MTAKAPSMGPRDAMYDADTARLLASLRKKPRKPMRRAPSAKPAAAKAPRKKG